MVFKNSAVPYFASVEEYIEMGMVPGGLGRNRDYRKGQVEFGQDVPQFVQDIMFDPQTSGGLLMAVPKAKARSFLKKLHEKGISAAAIVGEVVKEHKGKIKVI
jgi:selenide, water dikinase